MLHQAALSEKATYDTYSNNPDSFYYTFLEDANPKLMLLLLAWKIVRPNLEPSGEDLA
jgi:hypothetical protein